MVGVVGGGGQGVEGSGCEAVFLVVVAVLRVRVGDVGLVIVGVRCGWIIVVCSDRVEVEGVVIMVLVVVSFEKENRSGDRLYIAEGVVVVGLFVVDVLAVVAAERENRSGDRL